MCARLPLLSAGEAIKRHYVKYTSETIEVTYKDDQVPVRIVGAAPACLLNAYRAPVPEPPLTDLDCSEKITRETVR